MSRLTRLVACDPNATPLLWSHAGLVRIAWRILRGIPVDQRKVVADRYAELPPESSRKGHLGTRLP